jgi:alkylhydroperoxidase family enzyme
MTQRISFVPFDAMDERMQEEMRRCAEHGTPRPESSAVRAHAPNAFWAFADSWRDIFREGQCDHAVKELCRVYISRTVQCEFCGNQRSEQGAELGLQEMQYDELLNFEGSDVYDGRQKAALAYAQAIAWGPSSVTDMDELWDRLHGNFSDAELVELGCFIALTFGQQSWIRLLGVGHHQYMAGTSASLAPGFQTKEEYDASVAGGDYWAHKADTPD